jgi:hypothetical protein
MTQEAYQPTSLGKIFFALSENQGNGILYQSADSGIGWQSLYTFAFHVSGTIITDSNRLYIQSYEADGIYVSNDSGHSWNRLCGPENNYDNRFYVKDGKIWAGDETGNLWLNSTGKPNDPRLSKSW